MTVEPPKPAAPAPPPTKLDWDFGVPKLTAKEAVAKAILKNSVRTEAPKPVVSAPIPRGPLHYHQCARCQNIFGHTDDNHGDKQAHMCPACGFGPNYQKLR